MGTKPKPTTLLLIDWMNMLGRARDIVGFGTSVSHDEPRRPRLYPERLLLAICNKAREIADAHNEELTGRLYISVFVGDQSPMMALAEFCNEIGWLRMLTAPPRVRSPDRQRPRRWPDEPDPLDELLQRDALELVTTANNIRRVVLCTGDQDFVPLIASIHKEGVSVELISIPDMYSKNPDGLNETLRAAVDGGVHPIGNSLDPEPLREISTTPHSDMPLNELLKETDSAVGELMGLLFTAIKNAATGKQRFHEKQLVHAMWRTVMLKFIAAGLTKATVEEFVMRLQQEDEMGRWNGHLATVEKIETISAAGFPESLHFPHLEWKPLS